MLHISEQFLVELEWRLSAQHQQRKTVVVSLVTFQLCICIFYTVEAPAIVKSLLVYSVDPLYLAVIPR